MPIGTVYTVMPIPPEEDVTTHVTAGAVTLGVEVRVVDDALVGVQFKDATPEQKAEIAANKPANLNDGGVSVHVCSSQDGTEYLRFDCFRIEPHYHYISTSGGSQEIIKFDTVANGDMLEWAIDRITTRLAEMLHRAGATQLAGQVDPAAIEKALPEIRTACDEARRRAELPAANG
jgi:hypothetical protein